MLRYLYIYTIQIFTYIKYKKHWIATKQIIRERNIADIDIYAYT